MPHRNLGGRPPKYNEPSRPITVTLPESTLRQLDLINSDRGHAIVKLTNQLVAKDIQPTSVEIVDVGGKSGLILIEPCPALSRIPFLHLVEVVPSRFLLAIDHTQDFRSLELSIQDLLDDSAGISQRERALMDDLLATIRRLRRAERVTHADILLVDMDSKSRHDPKSPTQRVKVTAPLKE